MRLLRRNLQTVYYALYEGDTDVLDEDGYRTGHSIKSYSQPFKTKMNVSKAMGAAALEMFGTDRPYTQILITEDLKTNFDENTIFWIGIEPSGNPHNFIVREVSRSLNSTTIEVKKVNVNA